MTRNWGGKRRKSERKEEKGGIEGMARKAGEEEKEGSPAT